MPEARLQQMELPDSTANADEQEKEVVGPIVSLRDLFEAPMPALLARRINRAQQELDDSGALPPDVLPLSRVERNGALPLSFAQQRLWFLDQLEPGSLAFNLPLAVRMRGRLDVARLACALSEVVRRHEVLRTTFAEIDRVVVQVIGEPRDWPLPVEPEPLHAGTARGRSARSSDRKGDCSDGSITALTWSPSLICK